MWLINVNGIYPDKDFDISLSASIISAAESSHTHGLSVFQPIQSWLDNRAPAVHSHDFITGIKVNNSIVSGDVEFNSDSLSLSATDTTITIGNSAIPTAMPIRGIRNCCPNCDDLGVFVYTSTPSSVSADFTSIVLNSNGDRNDRND